MLEQIWTIPTKLTKSGQSTLSKEIVPINKHLETFSLESREIVLVSLISPYMKSNHFVGSQCTLLEYVRRVSNKINHEKTNHSYAEYMYQHNPDSYHRFSEATKTQFKVDEWSRHLYTFIDMLESFLIENNNVVGDIDGEKNREDEDPVHKGQD